MITKIAATIEDPIPFTWTSEEFERVAELGVFGDRKVELIEGQVLQMSPMGKDHVVAIILLAKELPLVAGDRYSVLIQGPIKIDEQTTPFPDAALLRGEARDFRKDFPMSALLVIEAADSTLRYDRTKKARLYARAGIPEYWIINLVDEQIEVLRSPNDKGDYADKTIFRKGDKISPVAAPELIYEVAKLLP